MGSKSRHSLFDDIFQLQTTIPDIDPEDPEDGFKSGLTYGATDDVEVFGSTQLKKQTALILDDPKYRGKRASRKDLYSDDEDEEQVHNFSRTEDDSSDDAGSYADDESGDGDDDDNDDDDDSDVLGGGDEDDFEGDEKEDLDDEDNTANEKSKDATVVTPNDGNDTEKGRAVSYQLGVWDDLIKCRISLQKMVTNCNRLPTPDVWGRFASFPSFKKQSTEAHKSMQQVLSSLLDLQEQISSNLQNKGKSKLEGSDEEITSESEPEDDKADSKEVKADGDDEDVSANDDEDVDGDDDDAIDEDMEGGGDEKNKEDDMDFDDEDEEDDAKEMKEERKRKLNISEVEQMLSKRHKKFQSFRNNTLAKWDEKTRLTHAKIKSKNFAAFDISVLTQIQQVLSNKGRLIRRIHQNRSSQRILGQLEAEEDKASQEMVLEDDEDEVEVRQRASKSDLDVNYQIVDDTDFYQMCLRDFIQLKQNEESDPVLANKHWLEIQNLRRKHKRKVDTRASKGRKIRYHVKEKLKNFMAPFDKSLWSEEQKDDLFKALFGGRQGSEADKDGDDDKEKAAPTINIGL